MTWLTESDTKYWAPVPQILAFLEGRFGGGKVLDVGPGHAPLPWATASVDFVNVPGAVNQVRCDLTREKLPFPDKSFDFVYCRHLLEDSWNPFAVCAEISRVGKAGYIETPSPTAELCRGVDGGSPPYRGYHHHRFLVWRVGATLMFMSKYPLIEYVGLPDETYLGRLRQGPKYWNTYYLWQDRIDTRHFESPADFNVGVDYASMLKTSELHSFDSTNKFWAKHIDQPSVIASLPQSFAAA